MYAISIKSAFIENMCILSFYCMFRLNPSTYKKTLRYTVLPAKSDSDVMFCLHHYQGRIKDRSCVH